jgi:isopentenyl diphosphate isomerase/L-lactate dehydrogenase-like FMN-dependent dehydrogenase
MCLSMSSSRTAEAVAEVGKKLWFQLYIMDDPRITEKLVRSVEDLGYRAIVITVDNNSFRSRERAVDYTALNDEAQFPIFQNLDITDPVTALNYQDRKSLTFTWSELEWVRSLTTLPIVLKGVVTAADAELAMHHGVDAIVVSNHGGHSLPGEAGTVPNLIEVVQAVGAGIEIYADGGIRHGRDVLKALALGARAVMIGRAQAWSLAAGGQRVLAETLAALRDELEIAMGLSGVTDVCSVPRELVRVSS